MQDTQWPSLPALSFHSHTAAHWNPTLSVSSIYISTTNTSLSGGKALALEIGMWLKNKYVWRCLCVMFGCRDQSVSDRHCRSCWLSITGAAVFSFLRSIFRKWFCLFGFIHLSCTELTPPLLLISSSLFSLLLLLLLLFGFFLVVVFLTLFSVDKGEKYCVIKDLLVKSERCMQIRWLFL